MHNACVSDLIDFNSKKWKKDLIRRFFLSFEADRILSILLSSHLPEDKLILHHTSCYSVKSAYHVIMEDLEMARSKGIGTSYSFNNSKEFMNLIWRQNVPNRNKHFIWRVCTHSLPTSANLAKRRIAASFKCLLCNQELETDMHLFRVCPYAYQIWLISGLVIFPLDYISSFDFMLDTLKNSNTFDYG